jgi:hypothetical protein
LVIDIFTEGATVLLTVMVVAPEVIDVGVAQVAFEFSVQVIASPVTKLEDV